MIASGHSEEELRAVLRRRGQRLTPQRLLLHRALAEHGHVTADRLFASVASRLPGLSLPTVYATLDLLVELGLARRLDTGTGAAVYDARTEPHQHAVCRSCRRVVDLDVELSGDALAAAARAAGFAPERTSVLVEGRCADCAA
jgi:Fur family ferric uptake transcriptional regulator/Fur family peroxide stress response transcriptional regulator